MIEKEAIEDFLSFHVYGCILFKHGKTEIGSSTFLFSISQKADFLPFYKGDTRESFLSFLTVDGFRGRCANSPAHFCSHMLN